MKNFYTRLKWLVVIFISILLFLYIIPVNAANMETDLQQEVRGVVSDQAGMPMPGVTVLVKDENRGTTTDIDGKYSLTIAPEDVLIFTFIGFTSHEEPVLGRREIHIQLKEDVSSLGEVQINAGYYNTTKRESTGNISRVTAEDIELQPVISPIDALQGRMAGVEIVPWGASYPGGASTIRIRGQNSLRSEGNFPLYIIDGVPIISTPIESESELKATGIDPLNNLDISNIQSIEVLKDADATAIYGSRGANGVVLITTKGGAYKRMGLEARVYTAFATQPNRIDLLNTDQYLQLRRKAFENDEVEPDEYNAYDLVLWDQNRETDWQEIFFGGTAETTNASVAISGGNESTFFRLGGSFFTQGSIYLGDYSYQKITGNFSVNHTSDDEKFNINFSANYGMDKNNLVSNFNVTSNAFSLPPNAPELFTDEGTINWDEWAEAGLYNPLAGFYNDSKTLTNALITNTSLSYQLFNGFKVRSNLGYTYFTGEELWKRPSRSYHPFDEQPNYSFHLNSNRKSWIIEPQLVYNTQIGRMNLDAILGATFQENSSHQLKFQGKGYASEIMIGNLAAADQILNVSNTTVDYRYTAFFGRLGIDFDKKYFLNFTGRRDGSSRFGSNNRFANFGAIGTAWIFSEELWIKETMPFLSFGKLRGSFGTTGNDQIGDYGYLNSYEATRGQGGLYPTNLANPNYSWEVNEKLEAAFDLGFFKDRLRVGVSRYHNESSNQLVGYPLPAITGFTKVQANLPATVRNQGWEVEASLLNFNTKNFYWQSSFNISIPKNILVNYPNLDQSSFANTYRVGHPLNISLRYQYDGVDPESGLYNVRDVNEDGRLDLEDQIVVQDLTRKFFGGISNNLTFKNFSMNFLWEFVKQEGILELVNPGALGNQSVAALQALEPGNPYQAVSQSFQAERAYFNVLNTTFPVVDASYLRLKTLSIEYNFPKAVLQKIKFNDLKFFVHGQNLLTVTPYKGLDPEVPSGTGFSGLRTISGGLQINL